MKDVVIVGAGPAGLFCAYELIENNPKLKIVMLDKIMPVDILSEGHQQELVTYKGVMVSKQHSEKDMFKINLLNMLGK